MKRVVATCFLVLTLLTSSAALVHAQPLAGAEFLNADGSEVLAIVFSSQADLADSVPLEPKDYFPLGMGIRKNSRVSLVPFCVAKNRAENTCTLAQYFEVVVGEFIDSDRVMDTRYGAPGDRVSGQTSAFHGKAIGSPFTGYIFSGGGFGEARERYIQSFAIPKKVGYGEVASSSLLMDINGAGGVAVVGAIPGFLVGLLLDRETSGPGGLEQWDGAWKGAAIGAVFPFAVYGVQTLAKNRQHRRTIRELAKKEVRIENAFNLSRQIRENWTLSKGAQVSNRTYDDFVEFLNSTAR